MKTQVMEAIREDARKRMADAWQSIETAPKDETPFLAAIWWADTEKWEILRMHWVAYAGRFGDATYAPFIEDQEQPMLWMPCPTPSTDPNTDSRYPSPPANPSVG